MSDYDKYQELGRELNCLRFMQHPKFDQVWREREEIKNRNGGMPPKKDTKK